MAGVEEELWNIFTFYTLRGNPLDLTRLSVRCVIRILHASLSNDWCGWDYLANSSCSPLSYECKGMDSSCCKR